MKKIERMALLLLLLFLLHLFPLASLAAPKFLIIHLDAVSSRDFFSYLEEGQLPNTEAAFLNGAMIEHGLTLFPGGTEIIYPRLKDGRSNEEGLPVGWAYYDREEKRVVSDTAILLQLLQSFPRRARSNFLYGAPFLDILMAPVFMNIPDLLEEYGVLEVFWFSADTYGHWKGQEAHEKSLLRFDRYLGLLLKRLDLSTTNLILYSDHGMSMGDLELIDIERELEEALGEEILYYAYPNIYLKDSNKAKEMAQRIIEKTSIDFALHHKKTNKVEGFFAGGQILFEEDHQKIRYTYRGHDPFHYDEEGYLGAFLSLDDWLLLTKDSLYPAAPPNLYSFVKNEKSGDVVIVINPPKIPLTVRANQGNHAGFTTTDLKIPILLQGKELERLYGREILWLHQLYQELDIPFDEAYPKRERHSLSYFLQGDLEIRLSPAYRWYLGLGLREDTYSLALEYDLYSSYLSRLWLGVGGEWIEKSLHPFLQARYQLKIGRLGFEGYLRAVEGQEMEVKRKISYKVLPHLSLHLFREGLGLSLMW